jgi:hypothetical protein
VPRKGTAERKAAEAMIVRYSPAVRRLTLGGDKIRFVSRSGNSIPLTQCGRRFRGILAAADRYASDVCYRSVSGIWMVTRSSSPIVRVIWPLPVTSSTKSMLPGPS